jgi:hypothetical protein
MDEKNQNTQQNTEQLPPQIHTDTLPMSQSDEVVAEKILSKSDKLKSSFFKILIGCLIGAASIAVIAVLAGSFSDILARALGTIAAVALHAIVSLSYIAETEKRDNNIPNRSLELFSNAVFVIIVISFITSIFAIWQLLDGSLTIRLYLMYGVLLFANFHADILYRIRKFENRIDNIVTANYFLMSAVVVMLAILIFSSDPSDLEEIFFRILAALAIIDATLTITAIIMHKLYLQKHPDLIVKTENTNSSQSKSFWKNPIVILLLIFLGFQIIGSLIALVMRGF